MQGWIKLHRELMNKPIWLESTPEQKVILVTVLMMANHKGNEWEWKGQRYKAEPGQFVTSLEAIAKNSGKGISVQNVRTALKRFQKYEFLTDESTNRNRLITIVNWGIYQSEEDEANRQTNSQLTGNQQAVNRQLTTNKNDKNEKNEKEDISSKSKKQNFEQVHMDLAEYLLNAIKENHPEFKQPTNLGNWAVTFRLMIDRDNRTEQAIRNCIDWVSGHDFWHKNILSADKLRKQYDRLVIEAKEDKAKFGVINGGKNNEDHRSSYGKRDFSKYKFR
ncbi:hypothetical protein ACSU6B_23395 [Neobacillus sp. C211]|uniref:hypothetical protein n=1 Tax=unclassified Neobacillus TaxID=2675272 RepID=UPI0039789B69